MPDDSWKGRSSIIPGNCHYGTVGPLKANKTDDPQPRLCLGPIYEFIGLPVFREAMAKSLETITGSP